MMSALRLESHMTNPAYDPAWKIYCPVDLN